MGNKLDLDYVVTDPDLINTQLGWYNALWSDNEFLHVRFSLL